MPRLATALVLAALCKGVLAVRVALALQLRGSLHHNTGHTEYTEYTEPTMMTTSGASTSLPVSGAHVPLQAC